MSDGTSDIERFRHEHESSAEWNLRKSFLEAHIDKFDETRLKCLSSCFINVEFYGCSYPGGVMEQLRILKEDIQDELDEFQATVKERTEVKFVKASDENSRGTSTAPVKTTSKSNKFLKPLAFVKSGDPLGGKSEPHGETSESGSKEATRTDKFVNKLAQAHTTIKAPPKKQTVALKNSATKMHAQEFFDPLKQMLSNLQSLGKSPIETLHMACQKCQLTVESVFKEMNNAKGNEFICSVYINSVFTASESGPSKKLAKHNAFSQAVNNVLTRTLPSSAKNESQQHNANQTQCNVTPTIDCISTNTQTKNRKRNVTHTRHIQDFYLIEHGSCRLNTSALQILNHSADLNKVAITYDFRETGQVGERCECVLMGEVLADIVSDSRPNAKLKVAERALEKLRYSNFTILVKQSVDADDDKLSKFEVVGEQKTKGAAAIPDSNIGNKLLKMMGWKGGGIGAEGNKGIAEPISVSGIVKREGLGLQAEKGIDRNFIPKVKKVIIKFLRSCREDDLAFSPEFKKEERALIHKEAQRFGLKTQSYGTDEDRFIVLKRKRSASELFSRVFREGGETHKYKLITPGQHPGLNKGGEGQQWAFADGGNSKVVDVNYATSDDEGEDEDLGDDTGE